MLLLFMLVTCRSQLDLYLLCFFDSWFCFQLFQNLFIHFVVKTGAPGCEMQLTDPEITVRDTH